MNSMVATAEKSSATTRQVECQSVPWVECQSVPWVDKQPRLAELCTSLAIRILVRVGFPCGDANDLLRLSQVRVAADGGASIRATIFDCIAHCVLTEREYALSDEILSILSAERR